MELIKWERLQDYIEEKIPAVIPVTGKKTAFVVGRDAASLSLRIPFPGLSEIGLSPYREITFDVRVVDKTQVLELTTEAVELFHSFYIFCVAVVELIEVNNYEPLAAIRDALSRFGQLLDQRALMSDAKRLGLFGELCFLNELLTSRGVNSFASWLGPLKERHDFRFDDFEFEVKSTQRVTRTHIINGSEQLEPSPKKRLFILSLQFERGGDGSGITLPERIYAVRKNISGSQLALNKFERYIESLGYREADAAFYSESFQFRSVPWIVPVDKNCPRLTNTELTKAISVNLVQRIGNIDYEINLDGLGFPEGSPEYESILPDVGPLR